ncbi:MAG TPA: ATP synthase subunit I [Gammaproteobacteria bacterium]|jgi:ATP synthase protein I|uniref:ATP synthase subunit I n=1 Tax=Immundisolibacter sp. TaxID=1934948 RepID=UPI000E9012A5|nr:ATP synthase subunit I [Gammaproteobacteria bacterium]HCZ49766.1 ATP synthase subunit I [Gammaproteobacteria bacterium]MCH79204.1 ATP synthase subunit I [Gammaproteobacteria bacterium]
MSERSNSAAWADDEAAQAAEEFGPPLTAEQAQALRDAQPMPGPGRIVLAQAAVGALLALLALAVFGRTGVAWSVLYGAGAVVLPSALMAYGIGRPLPEGASPSFGVVRVLVWEVVKLALTVLLLALAPRVVAALSWPALLLALVACLKVYWLALLWRGRWNRSEKRAEAYQTYGS